MWQNAWTRVMVTVCVLAGVAASGCSRGAGSAEAAIARAQTAVDVALDGWARGEAPEKFACSDPDWKAGSRLLSFLTSDARVVSQGPDHVRCRVALTLKDRQGKKLDRHVFYLVQLGDPITIRRDDQK